MAVLTSRVEDKEPKVLVGILYVGEPEFETLIKLLRHQKGVKLKIHIIKNKENLEAHKSLYSYFNANSDDFDYFIKIDADMLPIDDLAIWKFISEFPAGYNHYVKPVYDYVTRRGIYGIHLFKSDCFWIFKEDTYFVDPSPDNSIQYVDKIDDKFIFNHCAKMDNYFYFHFGIHRANKILQNGERLNLDRAITQINNFSNVLLLAKQRKEECYSFALEGFRSVFRGDIPTNNYGVNSEELKELYGKLEGSKTSKPRVVKEYLSLFNSIFKIHKGRAIKVLLLWIYRKLVR